MKAVWASLTILHFPANNLGTHSATLQRTSFTPKNGCQQIRGQPGPGGRTQRDGTDLDSGRAGGTAVRLAVSVQS